MAPHNLAVKTDPLPWLLESDPANPGVRFWALRDLLDREDDDAEVRDARVKIMSSGPVPAILSRQFAEGYWVKPGGGYSGKYRGTPWQVLLLAELGADPADERVRRACDYVLDHSRAANSGFAASDPAVPSAVIHCLGGNLLHALQQLGFSGDPRLIEVIEWEARAITGEAPTVRYYKSGTSGPDFACAANLGQPCGWGAVKALRGLSLVPPSARSASVERALAAGVEFLFSRDPAVADYPHTERVSSTWFKLGFPLSYWSDVLQTVEVLAALGYGHDRRLEAAVRLVLDKQGADGRWTLENSLNGKMWVDIEAKGKPSKWVTLRALRALRAAGWYEPGSIAQA